MREQVRFGVLGPVGAWRGTVEVDLGPPRQRAVLAVLLLAEGAQVPVGRLVDALWGDAPPASAVGSVRTYVHRLRRALGEQAPLIRSVGDAYVVRALPEDLDLAAFRESAARAERARRDGEFEEAAVRLRDALALWRGPALSGVRGEFTRAQRERLEALRLAALESLLVVRLDLGGHAQAAPELAALVAGHPLDERFREMLMLALYRSGRQSAALETYAEARALLAEELGVDPGPALRRLHERILRGDPGLLVVREEEGRGVGGANGGDVGAGWWTEGSLGGENPGAGVPAGGNLRSGSPGADVPVGGPPGAGDLGGGVPVGESLRGGNPGAGMPGGESLGGGNPGAGVPVRGNLRSGNPGVDVPVSGAPGAGDLGGGVPVGESLRGGNPGAGMPGGESLGGGNPGAGVPAGGKLRSGNPGAVMPIGGASGAGASVGEAAAGEESGPGAPVGSGAPVPVSPGTPVGEQPVVHAPVGTTPPTQPPGGTTPPTEPLIGTTPPTQPPVGTTPPTAPPLHTTPAVQDTVVRTPSSQTAPPPPAVPAQLPPGLPGFVGREVQLAQAAALVPEGDGPSATVVIGGTAGVGKTAFAVHWARQIAPRFPDGQLYLNLRGFDPVGAPVTPAQALRTLLEALGVAPRELPEDQDVLAARLRTVLAGRRVLILLDNARDAGQVRPLLPGGPGSLVIVTSRNRLGGLVAVDGARLLRLDVLTARECHDLLRRRLGAARVTAEPRAVRQIVELCARLPLALAVAAARAADRTDFPLTALTAELADGHGSLDAFTDADQAADVRAVLSWSYHALPPAAARLFRLLALHPGPDVSLPAAASLAGLGAPAARSLLAELVHAHLVDEPAPGRYAAHDLLRAYATELSAETDAPGEITAARRRMFDHYLHSAHAAAQLMDLTRDRIPLAEPSAGVRGESYPAPRRAMAWFAAERAVLVAVVREASVHGFDVHVWQLVWCVEHYFGRQGLWHELGVTLRTALESADRLGDPSALAHVHRGLAQAESYAKRISDARMHIERAIELFGEVGNVHALTECHRQLSVVLEVQGDLEGALDHHRRALELLGPEKTERTGDPELPGSDSRLRSWILNGLGWYHSLLGRHREALVYCAAALEPARANGDDYTLAHVLNSTGHAHHHLGAYDEAVAAFEEALVRFHRVGGVPWAEAHTLASLADSRLSLGHPERAHDLLVEAVRILDRLGHPDAGPMRAKLAALPLEGDRAVRAG